MFPDAVCDMLGAVGVAAEDIADERSQMSELAFGRTRNRSVLGTAALASIVTRGAADG